MKKSFFSLIIFISIILCSTLSAQDSYSIQINGGLISPWSSSDGFLGTAQFNYPVSSKISLYIYSGYSTWDKYIVYYQESLPLVHKQIIFRIYSADDHTLIPIYIGSKINFHTNSLFTAFLNFELGYSFISYNSYDIQKSVNAVTGAVLSYYTDQSSKKRINESVFGLGIGGGLSHPISERLNLILSYKFNSYANSDYPGLFSTKGMYSAFLVGLNYNI
jgi:opacity protein-like surface antigen